MALLILHRAEVSLALATDWRELLFWGLLVAIVNLIHVEIDPLQFTLDTPLLLALALLYHPAVAATVALVSSVDVREARGGVTLARAIFNRCQIAISVYAAGAIYHALFGFGAPWQTAIVGTALSMAVFYVSNTAFVTAYISVGGRATAGQVIRRLVIGRPVSYALTYFGYGLLALVLAQLYLEVGAWSVALFLIPIIVAHFALVRADRLQSLADRLRTRERLLERLSDRIVDERRDERTRIASGLHDDVLQSLIRMSQLGVFLRKETPPGTQAFQDAEEMVWLSDETIRVLRDVVGDLRKSPVGRGGVVRTLQGLAEDLRLQWRVPISVAGPAEIPLPPESQVAIYQAAKEGMLNALKHAQAESIDVTIRVSGGGLELVVRDDGKGFEPDYVDESSHFGLGLMRERIHLLGGCMDIQSRDDQGTRLIIRIPSSSRSASESHQ